ncbi:MAG: spore maturation protein [Clostridia bacterium]|nr:spore maturation protein [Clostridia bacterium]
MLAKTFSVMMIVSFLSALMTGNAHRMSGEFATSLSDGVTLCLSLLGMMCFWSGLMNVLRNSGVLEKLSSFLKPLMKLIYGKHALDEKNAENLSASFAANFLGLGNAALPLGINAVRDFEKNNKSGKARDSTIMFAVLNTVPFQLLPSTLIAMRAGYGSENPFDVVPYIWICSVIICTFAVVVCKVMARLWRDKE